MEWVETTGRTLEEARDAALDMLGVDESDAEFVTLAEPRPGLFGRLRGEARVRARVLPTTPPPKRGRARRSPQRRDQTAGARKPRSTDRTSTEPTSEESSITDAASVDTAAVTTSGAQGPGKSRSARRRRSRSTTRSADGSPVSDGAGTAEEDAGEDANAEAGANGGAAAQKAVRQTSSNGAGNLRSGSANRSQKKRQPRDSRKEEDTVTETLSLEEQGELAKRFIEGLITELGMRATVTARPIEEEEVVQVAVDGEELGILVGQGGATLSAIQELARTVVQRKAGGHIERIFVDIAGYRARRAEALGRFTRKVVEDVIAAGKDKALEPMSPADRKVVHDTVNEIGGAVTRSEGIEPRRYVVISPAPDAAGEQAPGEVPAEPAQAE
jgi:spoIIIJ-associated protein